MGVEANKMRRSVYIMHDDGKVRGLTLGFNMGRIEGLVNNFRRRGGGSAAQVAGSERY